MFGLKIQKQNDNWYFISLLVSSGGMGSSVGGSSGGTKGQKTTKKKLHQLSSMYGSLVEDANPELAF